VASLAIPRLFWAGISCLLEKQRALACLSPCPLQPAGLLKRLLLRLRSFHGGENEKNM